MLQVTSTPTFLLSAAGELGLDAAQCAWLRQMALQDPDARLSMTVAPAVPAVDPMVTTLRSRFTLTHREAEVALLIADRCSAKEIANRLRLSVFTVYRHTEQVLSKLGTPRSGVRDLCHGLSTAGHGGEVAA